MKLTAIGVTVFLQCCNESKQKKNKKTKINKSKANFQNALCVNNNEKL
jgi:hypothetical protein